MKNFYKNKKLWIMALLTLTILLSFQNCGKVKFDQVSNESTKVCRLNEFAIPLINQTTFTTSPANVEISLPTNVTLSDYILTVDFDLRPNSTPEINSEPANLHPTLMHSYTGVPNEVKNYIIRILVEKADSLCSNSFDFNILVDLRPPGACNLTLTGPSTATVGVPSGQFHVGTTSACSNTLDVHWDQNYNGTFSSDIDTNTNTMTQVTYTKAGQYRLISGILFDNATVHQLSNELSVTATCPTPTTHENDDRYCVCHSTGQITTNGICQPCGPGAFNPPHAALGCQCPTGSTYSQTERRCICTGTGLTPVGTPPTCPVNPPPPVGQCFTTTAEQNGTASLPWKISTCECLQAIETKRENSQKSHHFKLMQNLNCSTLPTGFKSIQGFTGHLDGNYQTISNTQLDFSSTALFRNLSESASIKNLTINNFKAIHLPPHGQTHTILAEYTSAGSLIENLTIEASSVLGFDVAGVVGYHSGTMRNVTVKANLDGKKVGGLAIHTTPGSLIVDSSFEGNIKLNQTAGGIVNAHAGEIRHTNAQVQFEFQGQPDRNIHIGGITSSSLVSDGTGTHAGRILNSKVLSGSKMMINLNAPAGVFEIHLGRISIRQGGLISDTEANIDIDLRVTNENPLTRTLIGGVSTLCSAATAQSTNITARGNVLTQGVFFDVLPNTVNPSVIKNNWVYIDGGSVCSHNQVDSTFNVINP